MKIALLGNTNSGKTVYFTALYHLYHNEIGDPYLTDGQRAEYERKNIDCKAGFRMFVENADLAAELQANAMKLMQRPIVDWPLPTERLNKSKLDIEFDFIPLNVYNDIRRYRRTIELYDPAGGALTGAIMGASGILKELATCDVAIVFLPADVIANEIDADNIGSIDENDLAYVRARYVLGETQRILDTMNSQTRPNDIFPVCFVVSKMDLVSRDKVDFVRDFIDKCIVEPLSKRHKRFMVCVCPTAVVNPKTGNFSAHNLEWPFLFAAGGTIFRNSQGLMKEADRYSSYAATAEDEASDLEELYNRSKWGYFKNWLKSKGTETFNNKKRAARSYHDSAGRKIEEADDDAALARDIWASLDAEGEGRGVRVLMNGELINILEST